MITIYSNVWRRIASYLVDGLLMLVVMGSIGFVVYKLLTPTGGSQEDQVRILTMLLSLSTVLVLLVSQAYEIIMVKKYQATVGKLLLKVKVTDLGGNPLTWGRSGARSLIKVGHVFLAGLIADFLLKSTSTGIQEKLTALGTPPSDAKAAMMLALGSMAIGLLSFAISMTGNWLCLFNAKRQTIHDMMAGTYVVKK
jgi:uncharacterized RDD family membrane protein YckC